MEGGRMSRNYVPKNMTSVIKGENFRAKPILLTFFLKILFTLPIFNPTKYNCFIRRTRSECKKCQFRIGLCRNRYENRNSRKSSNFCVTIPISILKNPWKTGHKTQENLQIRHLTSSKTAPTPHIIPYKKDTIQ